MLSGQDDILRNVINSLIVGVLTAVITAVVATLAGYGFAMFPFRGSGLAFGVVLVAFMIPFQAVLTPLFLELHFLHLLNSLIGLALFNTTFNLPLGVFVMRNSFLQVPQELADAARVDGASVIQVAGLGVPAAGHAGDRHHGAVRVLVLVDRVPRRAELPHQRQPVHAAGRAQQRGDRAPTARSTTGCCSRARSSR